MSKQIAYITDIHIDEPFPIKHGVNARSNWKKVLDDVASRNINHIIFGGDAGEKESNEWFFNTLKDFRLDMVLGNHDYYDEVIKHYSNEYQSGHAEMYYAYEDDHFSYIFLDSSSDSIGDTQFEWFKKQLNTTKQILLFIHHAILKVDTAVDVQYPLLNRDRIKEELQKHTGEVTIFCGHYHMLDEQKQGNIYQVVNPATSYQMIKEADPIQVHSNDFSYRIISIEGDSISTELITF